MKFSIDTYESSQRSVWNEALKQMRQQSFLLDRGFMDYHSDRFEDVSLMVYDEKGHVVALLPANKDPQGKAQVQSHGGLTYGGLLTLPNQGTKDVGEILASCVNHYANAGFDELLYKPMPHIYHTQPAEEDLYWMHRMGAQLVHRSVSSAVLLPEALPFSKLRKRKVKKAQSVQHLTHSTSPRWLPQFWQTLDEVLSSRHHTHPVHTLAELELLMSRFPERIVLHTLVNSAPYEANCSRLLAGCLLFIMPSVVHVQYIAASDEGRDKGALDLLFHDIIAQMQCTMPHVRYLDFGISTESHGQWLNEGLIFQKEGFGARAVCYDEYLLSLHDATVLTNPIIQHSEPSA